MTVVIPPSTQPVLDVDGPHWADGNIPYRQLLPSGSVVTWGWTSGVQSSGSNAFDADLYDVQTGTPVALRGGGMTWSAMSGAESFSVTLAADAEAALLLEAGGAGGHHSAGTLYGFHAEVTVPGGFCQYGSRLQGGQQTVLIITEAVIAAATILVPELELFAIIWGAFVGWTFVPGSVCASPPPDIPTFTDADFLFGGQVPAPGSVPKFWQALQAALWRLYCECIPATGILPPPVPYPPPYVPPPPSGIPLPPGPIVCDGADLCATLNAIMALQRTMLAQLAYVRTDVQLIQRQAVPFSYLVSTSHAGLSGNGQIAVQGLIGVSIDFTTIPGHLGLSSGNPDAHLFLGWLNLGTAHGWQRAHHLVDQPTLRLPIGGEISLIGYSLEAGVVATITELVREP